MDKQTKNKKESYPHFPQQPIVLLTTAMAMRKSLAWRYTGEKASRKMCPSGAIQMGREVWSSFRSRILL